MNEAVNAMIGRGFLTKEEGKEMKHAIFFSAVKAIQKPKPSSKATPEDVFAAIRSAATQLKPASQRHLKSPPPPPPKPTGAGVLAQKAMAATAARRQAVAPADEEEDEKDDDWD